ncbi:CC0125/CC1285 family lipoprotein [Hyphomonas pacifica]|uniref:Lipoprotein n=1 Tax=Hyphomonas pacifica TaxID=1280941 RepID=A0A062TWH5_9PROT|nr:hypothetical protein [Hyphomonas pacifica]KCZ48432.1 hypothetical protein HY2_04285 [Hyphomonas pacifica]RAN31744.1 hypothetical protein HY3_03980 [Hyphomonas pacifica]RAN32136.1 hypothetical protein HY11_06040 [Hyphomonas pacifica]
MKYSLILALCGLMITTACASSPDYRPALTDDGQGYSSQVIEANRYRVTYRGDTAQTSAEVQNMALLRAAEVTMEHGGDWFEIVGDETSGDVKTQQRLADQDITTRPELRRDCGLLGCTTRGYPVDVRRSDIETETRVIYSHTLEMVIHQGPKPQGNSRAYDAVETAANLRTTID